MSDLWAIALLAAAVGFALSIGAHYTGACMGMAYAARALRLRTALLIMAPLALGGAILASGAVEATVGGQLLGAPVVQLPLGFSIIGSAFALTAAYNFVRLPTSTIQILVFAVVGGGIAEGVPVEWSTIEHLVVVWAVVPPLAALLGFLATRWTAPRSGSTHPAWERGAAVGGVLVVAGAVASFVMGANDVSNASGALVMTGLIGPLAAAAIGGAGLSVGVITWGRPLLQRVAFETVSLDRRTASIAQFVQSGLVLGAVAVGLFTSLNQALIGAMAGTGLARGRSTVNRSVVLGILAGWAVGPASGFALALVVTSALRALGALP
ncbi:MAG TPA: anion permease [Thermoplasmata archaeon]|nr:anion permease [Thermoplasmata archaeon]